MQGIDKIQSSFYFDIIWLFSGVGLLLDLAHNLIWCTFSEINFAASINCNLLRCLESACKICKFDLCRTITRAVLKLTHIEVREK